MVWELENKYIIDNSYNLLEATFVSGYVLGTSSPLLHLTLTTTLGGCVVQVVAPRNLVQTPAALASPGSLSKMQSLGLPLPQIC